MGRSVPAISVVVPAHNAAKTLGACLAGLERQTVPRHEYELIVVDDGSTDATREVAGQFAVRLVCQPKRGPAAARNLGARGARGDLLLFTDADCVPAPDWIAKMQSPFADPAVAGAKGVYRSRQGSLVARFVQLEYEDKYDRMRGENYIDFVDSYSAAYRRSIFLENGGFDTTFPSASVEDQEFSFRLARRGYKMVLVPDAAVEHLGHADTLLKYLRKKFRIGYWKVLVGRRFPEKLVQDSHTPTVLRVQVALAAAGVVALLGGPLRPALWRAGGAVGVLFLASCLPFAIKAGRKDLAVAAVAPALLLARAAALGAGFTAGLVRQPRARRAPGSGH